MKLYDWVDTDTDMGMPMYFQMLIQLGGCTKLNLKFASENTDQGRGTLVVNLSNILCEDEKITICG